MLISADISSSVVASCVLWNVRGCWRVVKNLLHVRDHVVDGLEVSLGVVASVLHLCHRRQDSITLGLQHAIAAHARSILTDLYLS